MRYFICFIFLLFIQVARADPNPASAQIMPRTILMLTNQDVDQSDAFLYGTFPLNYLGYKAEYADLRQPLPETLQHDRYAGIVVWSTSQDIPSQALHDWAIKQIQAGFPIVFLSSFDFTLTDNNLAPFGLNVVHQEQTLSRTHVAIQSPLMGYEIQPFPAQLENTLFHLKNQQPLLRIADQQNNYTDMAAITSWGGYALDPYLIQTLPNEENRWIINPIEFYRQALRLPDMPVPDVSTENGRRLMMVHVDGDAFISRTEFDPKHLAGETMYTEIFERFQIPTTVSIIIGEIAPFGVAPQLSTQAMKAARAIFKLPWVEIASHTYSHPFHWKAEENNKKGKSTEGDALNLPHYKFNLDTEITGSIDFINRYLAPPGKFCKVLLWSGDTSPSMEAVKLTYEDHVANMNGGDTTITDENNSLSDVAPLYLALGPYLQVYAPNENEEIYTNDWQGPFYGFITVIQTFQLTNTPLRLKPIDLYYHFYSATKKASLEALKTIYAWTLTQPIMNIYVSDYFKKVLDFNDLTLAKIQDGFIVYNHGDLRELRALRHLGKPDLLNSENLVGYSVYGNDYYLHLGPATTSILRFLPSENLKTGSSDGDLQSAVQWLMNLPYLGQLVRLSVILPKESGPPYLVDANGRVTAFSRDQHSMTLDLEGYLPLIFTLGNMTDCSISSNGQVLLQGHFLENNQEQFTLNDRSADLRIVCQ